MDISKIRKKAKEQEEQNGKDSQKPEERPAEEEAETTAAAEPEETAPPEEVPAEEELPETLAEEELIPETLSDMPLTALLEESPGGEERAGEEILELLTFLVGKEEFALRVDEVEEIIRQQAITRVPGTPEYVSGITSLRGKIIPVVDLRKRLNLEERTYRPLHAGVHAADASAEMAGAKPGEGDNGNSDRNREKILIIDGPKGIIGADIDRIMGVVRVPAEELRNPPAHLSEQELELIEGVVILKKRFISVIRADETMNIEIG